MTQRIRALAFVSIGLVTGLAFAVHLRTAAADPNARAVLTADTDATQLVTSTVPYSSSFVPVSVGPFVLTDVAFNGQSFVSLVVTQGADCTQPYPGIYAAQFQYGSAVHGSRFFVPAGYVACAQSQNGSSVISGFRPY